MGISYRQGLSVRGEWEIVAPQSISVPAAGVAWLSHLDLAMRNLRIALTLLFGSLLVFLPGVPTAGTSSLYGQCETGCPLAGTLMVPFLPGPAGCVAMGLPEFCPVPVCPPPPCDPPTPVVRIKVRVPACGQPGEPVEYSIRVDNDSPADAHHVVVKNALPANARFVRASPEPHVKEPELQWRLGTMKAGACYEITLVLQPEPVAGLGNPAYAEDLRNCTRVAFEHGQCVTTRVANTGGLTPGRSPQKGPPEVLPIPKIPTEKEPPVKPGVEEIHQLTMAIDGPKTQYLNVATAYFITVANKGKFAATNLLVDFTLGDKGIYLKASDEGKHIEGKVAWVLGTLEPGASRTVVVQLKSTTIGELCHKATAASPTRVPGAQAEFCTTFAGVSALLLELSENENPIPVGGATSYPVKISNTGTAPVTNLRLKAFIPDGVTLTRAKAAVNHNLGEALPGQKVLVFDSLPTLGPGAKTDYQIFVQGGPAGGCAFPDRNERADQLESGPVIQEQSARFWGRE